MSRDYGLSNKEKQTVLDIRLVEEESAYSAFNTTEFNEWMSNKIGVISK